VGWGVDCDEGRRQFNIVWRQRKVLMFVFALALVMVRGVRVPSTPSLLLSWCFAPTRYTHADTYTHAQTQTHTRTNTHIHTRAFDASVLSM
jgi:hypothetical protein